MPSILLGQHRSVRLGRILSLSDAIHREIKIVSYELTSIGFAQSCGRALGQPDVFGLAGLSKLIQSRNGFVKRCSSHHVSISIELEPDSPDNHTGIDPMKVVEVWRKAKSLHGSLNIGLDVRGRVRDTSVSAIQAVEATF